MRYYPWAKTIHFFLGNLILPLALSGRFEECTAGKIYLYVFRLFAHFLHIDYQSLVNFSCKLTTRKRQTT